MKIGSEVEIIPFTSFDQTLVHHPLGKNKVRISFYQRLQRFELDESDGILTCIGLDSPTHLPARQVSLYLFSHELRPNYLFTLINARLHDRSLSLRIARGIAAEAKQYVGFLQPYFISFYVFKTQNVVSQKEQEEEEEETQKEEEDKEDEEESTCSICLEGLCKNDETFDLPFCSHRFHDRCIGEWLESNNNSCPLCREILF